MDGRERSFSEISGRDLHEAVFWKQDTEAV
jgi:hypothetical protein